MRNPDSNAGRRRPGGITLLEVLVSCGLLIVGLTTIAALLPTAGFRLNEATTEDRAAVLLSNATAEILNRGLVAADSFTTTGTTGGRTLTIGRVLGRLPAYGVLPSGRFAGDYFTGPSAAARRRSGSARTFLLEDGLAYDPPRYTDTPSNAFGRDAAGYGPRVFREGMCWGATLTPETMPPAPGVRAGLAIAIFKRGGAAEDGPFEEGMAVALTRIGGVYEADAAATGSLFRGCSWLLAIPPDTSRPPRWFRIMSSWNWQSSTGRARRLVMRNQEEFESLTGSAASGSTAIVFAFEGLVRVDEQVVTLN